jgi:hypothetical protein
MHRSRIGVVHIDHSIAEQTDGVDESAVSWPR